MIDPPHDWRPTKLRRVHVRRDEQRERERSVSYIRCALCGALGFRYDGSRVVYTWVRD